MANTCKIDIRIKTDTEERQMAIANSIHHQLVGNQDYIDNNIVLNIDTDNEVNLYVFEECEDIPDIII